jgi:hypothetical protein
MVDYLKLAKKLVNSISAKFSELEDKPNDGLETIFDDASDFLLKWSVERKPAHIHVLFVLLV